MFGPLNHNHLFYFWKTATEGSIVRAAERLHITPQTISTQVKLLEESLSVRLFVREGRGLRLTDAGRTTKTYADEIFGLSRELQAALRGQSQRVVSELRVGVADALPKLVCRHILEPVLHLEDSLRLVCREEGVEKLLGELAVHNLDLVLNDAPMPQGLNVRAYNHLLGQCPVVLMATPALARRYRSQFPACLEDAPFILPTSDTALRRSLDQWFHENGIQPRIIAEIVDSALVKAFGAQGAGIFAIPDIIVDEVMEQYGVAPVGVPEDVIERFYAITVNRRIRHPALVALTETAKSSLFASTAARPRRT